MVSSGGAIGVGMFLGSGGAISLAGPAVIGAYLLGAVLMMLVMAALAEMSIAMPVPGSLRAYASMCLGEWAGFVTGWMYWLSWVVLMAAEVCAVTTYLGHWMPTRSALSIGFVCALFMTWVNLMGVESFGEFDFWFCVIKVLAILGFIWVGASVVFGFGRFVPIGLANYVSHGGLLPNGTRGMLLSLSLVMVAFSGTEVLGVAAAETHEPHKSVPLALWAILFRTLVLFVMAIAVLVAVVPWNQVGVFGSPFVFMFESAGLRSPAHAMNVVVVIAAMSSMNLGLYTSSRMLHSLSREGMCSARLGVLDANSVPKNAVLVSAAGLFAGVCLHHLSPSGALGAVMQVAAFGFMFTWLIIALSHIRFRQLFSRTLQFRFPGYPYASYMSAFCILAVLWSLWLIPGQRAGVAIGLSFVALTSLVFLLLYKQRAHTKPHAAETLRLASFFGFSRKPRR